MAHTHVAALREKAGVAPKRAPSPRHGAGTRLYAEPGDLGETATWVHTKLDAIRSYANVHPFGWMQRAHLRRFHPN